MILRCAILVSQADLGRKKEQNDGKMVLIDEGIFTNK